MHGRARPSGGLGSRGRAPGEASIRSRCWTGALHVKLNGHIDLTEQASTELCGHADATWGDRNMYGLVILYANAAIFHVTKKLGLVVDSSMEAEGIATSKIAEQISYVREILRAFGVPQQGPTFIGTDNTANQRVASGAAVPSRSKHFLRRYHVLLQRVRSQEITIGHVPDRAMPADFLTKWIGASKLNVSVEHVTNSRHAPTPYATHLSDLKCNPRHGLGGVLDGRLGIRSGTRVTSPSHAR